MSLQTYLLEQTLVYKLWQAPFVADKLTTLLAYNDLRKVRRVLDVGCGPGTNTELFAQSEYLGIDVNPSYIEYARRKYKRSFVAADITTYQDTPEAEKFDFILLNSFLHHVADPDCHKILSHPVTRLSHDGYLHILELVLPGDPSVAQLLAKWDRGKFLRCREEWRALFEEHLDVSIFAPYSVKLWGTTLWNMIYCKGRAR
jgi:SAM-dependent methyltransferase